LEKNLNSEINTLGYPRAALFGFSVAVVAYNIMSVIQGALRAVHGAERIEQEVSGYYIAGEISATYVGMMIAIPEKQWRVFRRMAAQEFADVLCFLASKAHLAKYKRHPRGPKKPQPKRTYDKKHPHVSTFRLLQQRKSN